MTGVHKKGLKAERNDRLKGLKQTRLCEDLTHSVWEFNYSNQDCVDASRLEATPATIIIHEYDSNQGAELLSR